MTLPEASCSACQQVTSEIERFILQEAFGLWRERLGVKSRNRKKSRKKNRRPKEASIKIIDNYESEIVPLRTQDFPAFIALPHWGTSMLGWAPGMIQPAVTDELVMKFVASDAERLLDLASGRPYEINIQKFNRTVFARFLTKIAYSFAYAALGGLPSQSDLPAIILKPNSFFRHRVGSEKVSSAAGYFWSVALGVAQMRDGSKWLGAHIDLLTPFEFPRYEVLICKLTDKEFKLPSFAHNAFGMKIKHV